MAGGDIERFRVYPRLKLIPLGTFDSDAVGERVSSRRLQAALPRRQAALIEKTMAEAVIAFLLSNNGLVAFLADCIHPGVRPEARCHMRAKMLRWMRLKLRSLDENRMFQ